MTGWDDDLDPAAWAAARMSEIRQRSGGGVISADGRARPVDDAAGWDAPDDVPAAGEVSRGTKAGPRPSRPIIPGQRAFRDGDRVRHERWGEGIVVTSRLTRSDEEITVAFRDPQVGRKTVLASLANLELIG